MTTNPRDPALQGAMTFFSAGMYPIFDAIGLVKSREAADFCSAWSQEEVMCRDAKGEFPQREIPHFKRQSIVYAITLMTAFLVWTQKGKSLPASPLFEAALMGYRLSGATP